MINGSNILVTGGTGSFGRAFIAHVFRCHYPRRLVVFSRDELKQHEMRMAWPETDDSPVRYFIGDVRDRDRLRRALHGIDVVVHAAALKQVPACEYNPREAIHTNIIGAMNVIDAALDCGVGRVIALSTDKCCAPTNLYGATKLVAEKLFVQANAYRGEGGTLFSCVRYGNVIGSRGSVIPLWREQAKSGRVTITDGRMTRFLITLPQAVRFVLLCLETMAGGEVFVPRLPTMAITDMAAAIAPACEQEVIGVRPGEKLAEALISVHEVPRTVDLGDRFAILPEHPWWSETTYAGAKRLDGQYIESGYASNTNDRWLTTAELLEMVGDD